MTTLYDSTVPIFIRGLENLSGVLAKATTHIKENQAEGEKDFIEGRLHADMKPLTFQIQSVSDTSKNGVVRISNSTLEQVSMEDNESTFDELQARVRKTIDFLKTVKPENVNGNEGLTINPKMGPYQFQFVVRDYVSEYMIPNFFFHMSMAYAILRNKGVPVGKRDFLGPDLFSKVVQS